MAIILIACLLISFLAMSLPSLAIGEVFSESFASSGVLDASDIMGAVSLASAPLHTSPAQ